MGEATTQGHTPLKISSGLDPQRQWYLYNIREFVKEADKDTLCPLPTVPRPSTKRPPETRESSPPPKRARGSGRGGARGRGRGGATPRA